MLQIAYVVFPGFGVMTFGAMSVFEAANTVLGRRHYDVQLLSEAGGPVRSSIGVAEFGHAGSARTRSAVGRAWP